MSKASTDGPDAQRSAGMKYRHSHLYCEAEVVAALREHVHEAGSQKIVAAYAGVSASYLNDVLRGKRRINGALLRFTGYERVEYFRAVKNDESK